MKRLATIGLGGLAASLLFLGCASAPAPTKVDPVLNPKGLPEIAPEDAEPLIPPQIEAERAAIADRPFALPANFAEGEWERMVVAINPYDNVADSETVRTAQLAALNAGIRATLVKLTRFEVREVSADKPDPACTHTAKWTAAIRGEAKPSTMADVVASTVDGVLKEGEKDRRRYRRRRIRTQKQQEKLHRSNSDRAADTEEKQWIENIWH